MGPLAFAEELDEIGLGGKSINGRLLSENKSIIRLGPRKGRYSIRRNRLRETELSASNLLEARVLFPRGLASAGPISGESTWERGTIQR